MSYSLEGNRRVAPTASDLSAQTGKAVVLSAGNLIVNTTAGGRILGILVDDPKSGEYGTYQVAGVVKCVAGAGVTAGDLVVSNNAGKVITAATTGHHIIGRALATASGDGSVIPVELGYLGIV